VYYLWQGIKHIKLWRNMRALSDPWLSDFLLRIGDGTEKSIGQDYVCLPKKIIIGLHRILGIITAKQGSR
jgi:ATP-dependent DNA helicase PIF1